MGKIKYEYYFALWAMFRLILNTFLNHIFTPRHEMRNGIV